MLLGEVNLPPRPLAKFFGGHPGDQLHMLFNFPVMQRMYLALARERPAAGTAAQTVAENPTRVSMGQLRPQP